MTWVRDDRADWQILDVTGRDPADSTSARHWVQDRIAAFGEEHRIDTLLVAGELLENAYQHAGGPAQVRLRLRHEPCEITVAVADTAGGVPRLRVPDDGGGRGLVLVDQLCSSWGVSHHDDGKLVWGRVGCAGTGFACPDRHDAGS
ncbi:ATP-binding protein [Amycolatopsis sp. NPDC088138]|uniref:ATP-binding protein n=1 Tax=Amycolatopsis sp. NPDC088138 TaxID=3363938 RepID=UPI003815ED61